VAQQWQQAGTLASAETLVCSEPSLADLDARVAELLATADRELTRQAARRKVEEKQRQFVRLHDEALFHGTLFTGVDLPANLATTRTAAREALALFLPSPPTPLPRSGGEGGKADPTAELSLDDAFTSDERKQITAGCHELLLILAEAESRQSPPQPDEALRILDRASRLSPPTHAYHLRRARYLRQQNNEAAARQEEQQASAVPPAGATDHFLLGEDLRRQGKQAEAVRAFHSAASRSRTTSGAACSPFVRCRPSRASPRPI
jgi:tetratricopeptide (TPR) repeat protein